MKVLNLEEPDQVPFADWVDPDIRRKLIHTLPYGTIEEVEAEVKERIDKIGKGGGFILGTANSITDFCKVENVMAMS